MKTLLCAIIRNENEYLREWVEYYINKLKFSHIVLYDNNYNEEEHPEEVLADYIIEGSVSIINYRGKKICQLEAYNNCLKENYSQYDWMAFFDADEFLIFQDSPNKTIEEYLTSNKFCNFDCILVQWLTIGDSGKIFKEDDDIMQRFTEISVNVWENNLTKSIIRGGIEGIYFDKKSSHGPDFIEEEKFCNGNGDSIQEEENKPWVFKSKTRYSDGIILHFITKSLEEYINKVKRGYPDQILTIDKNYIEKKLREVYFRINKPSEEKIEYIKKVLDIDLGDLLLK